MPRIKASPASTTSKKREPKKAKKLFRVTSGKQYVNTAYVRFDSPMCCIIEIDMILKRADVDWCHTSDHGDPPAIGFRATQYSYFGGKSCGGAEGVIEFPCMTGWNLYAATRTGRYTLSVVFLKENQTSSSASQA